MKLFGLEITRVNRPNKYDDFDSWLASYRNTINSSHDANFRESGLLVIDCIIGTWRNGATTSSSDPKFVRGGHKPLIYSMDGPPVRGS
jgi:hypothetical protein